MLIKRKIAMVMGIIVFGVLLAGCGNEYGKLNEKEIQSIVLSKVGEEMGNIKEPHITYVPKDADAIETIADAINQAEKVDGIVNVTTPNYSVVITFANDSVGRYSLWLNDGYGSVMDEKDTHTLYTIPSDIVKALEPFVN